MSLLSLSGVTRSVDLPNAPPLPILKGIDLEVSVGDHVSIVGRSGSGKSTLLKLLGLLDNPTEGEIRFDDKRISAMSGNERDRCRRRNVGFIFQQFNILSGRTAFENVMTPLLFASVDSSATAKSSRSACSPGSGSTAARRACPRSCRVVSSSGWR